MPDESLQPKEIRQQAFLRAFRNCANITRAAMAANVCRDTHYAWLAEDPEYNNAFQQAKKAAAEVLEETLYNRAVEGQSDTCLIFALKGAMPDKYRERISNEVSGPGGGPLTVDVVYSNAPSKA